MPTTSDPLQINPLAAAQDPSYLATMMQANRRLQMAQALTSQGLEPIQYDPHGRISPLQGLSKLAAALLGNQQGSDAIQALAGATSRGNAITRSAFMGDPGSSQQPSTVGSTAPAAASPSPSSQVLGQGAANGSVGPTAANASRLAQILRSQSDPTSTNGDSSNSALQPSQKGGDMLGPFSHTQGQAMPAPSSSPAGGPLSMPGMPPQQAYMAYLTDPKGYMDELVKRSDNRTDFTKMLLSTGIDPQSPIGKQMVDAWVRKQTYIAPVEMHPGGGVMDATTGQITTMPSAAPDGFQNVRLANGSWGLVPVAGGIAGVTQSTAAKEEAKAPFQLIESYDPARQAPVKNYAGNLLPLPGRQGSQSGMSGPQTLPTPQSAPSRAPAKIDTTAQLAAIRDSIPYLQQDVENARKGGDPAAFAGAQRQLADAQARLQAGTPWSSPPVAPQAAGVQSGPSLGAAQGATNAQDELSKQWGAQVQAHSTAQTNIALLQQIEGLADRAFTGAEPDRKVYLAKLASAVGVKGWDDAATSSDLMSKFGSQLIQGISSKFGMSTDSARDLVLAGTPNSKMTSTAIREASKSMIAREEMTQARTAALQPYASSRDPSGFQSAATQFDRTADPRLWQMRSMSSDQLARFVGSLSKPDAAALAQKYQQAKASGFLQ